MSKPLTIEQKLAIALAREKSLRALAEEYGVHHSTIAEICQESEALLRDYWAEKTKRIGRPAKPVDSLTMAAAQEKVALEKALALKEMRIDFLELKLRWAEARAQEAQCKIDKQLKKKEKIALIELADEHGQKYRDLTQGERLRCLDTTAAAFNQLQKHIDQRLQRESCIAEEDIEHTVQQIITYPYLGGKKGSLKLQGDEKALIGGTTYQEIKQQLKTLVAKEVLDRHEQSEIEKDQYRRAHAKATPFEKIAPQKKHEVWAIDFLNFLLFGIYFRICIVYDVFSQAYLAIKPAYCATSAVARQALEAACAYSGQTPKRCLMSDNGPQFESYDFEDIKQRLEIESQFIPRGQPWHNGALESGNRDVRKALYTIAFYAACEDAGISKTGVDAERIYALVLDCCQEALVVINEAIVRPKFKTTPRAVLNDQVVESQQKRLRFIEQKQRERKQRMAELKVNGGTKRRRIEEKVVAAWKKIAAKKTTNQLFAFRELLHQRYRAITN